MVPAEFLSLKNAVAAVEEQFARASWLSAESRAFTELQTAFLAFTNMCRTRQKLLASRDTCASVLQACEKMNPDVRRSVLSSLATLDRLPPAQVEALQPLMDAVSQSGDALNRLPESAPERSRMSSLLALDYSCLKLLYSLGSLGIMAPGGLPQAAIPEPEPEPIPEPIPEPVAEIKRPPPPADTRKFDNSREIIVRGQVIRR